MVLDVPNFAALYDVDDELTPRMAARLWISAGSAADSFDDGWGEVWMSRLPRVGQL